MITEPENTGEIKRIKGRYAPGVSGNPAGKPPGAKHLSTKLLHALEQLAEGGNSYADLLNKRVIKDAIEKGNTSLIHLIYNYIDGMPQQGIDLTSKGEQINATTDVMEIAQRVSEELKKKKTNE